MNWNCSLNGPNSYSKMVLFASLCVCLYVCVQPGTIDPSLQSTSFELTQNREWRLFCRILWFPLFYELCASVFQHECLPSLALWKTVWSPKQWYQRRIILLSPSAERYSRKWFPLYHFPSIWTKCFLISRPSGNYILKMPVCWSVILQI